jgi:hypothetical protein
MDVRKFYTGRTLGFLIVLAMVFLGAYFLKDKETVTLAPIIQEEQKEPVAIFITNEDIKEENFTGKVAIVSGDSILAKKAREYIEDTVSEFRTQANTDVPDMRVEFGEDSPSANYTIEIQASIVESEKTESIIISIYAYTGGAHGNSAYKIFTSSKDDKNILSLSEIIKTDKQLTFTEFVKKELKAWAPNGSVAPVVFPEQVDSLKFESFENWSLDEQNLTLYFSQYEIGPGVLGPVEFPISLTKVKGFLK